MHKENLIYLLFLDFIPFKIYYSLKYIQLPIINFD